MSENLVEECVCEGHGRVMFSFLYTTHQGQWPCLDVTAEKGKIFTANMKCDIVLGPREKRMEKESHISKVTAGRGRTLTPGCPCCPCVQQQRL